MEKTLELSFTTSTRSAGVLGTPWGDASELPTSHQLCEDRRGLPALLHLLGWAFWGHDRGRSQILLASLFPKSKATR